MIIKNGKVFIENAIFEEKNICMDGDKISDVESGEIIDATGLYVIPGLIDIHFHGCMGYDFCDGTPEALKKMAEYELSNGITTICPASMTLSEEMLTKIFSNAANYKEDTGATLAGIHMEGPFISEEKKGAQSAEFIHKPDVEMFERLQKAAGGLIKICDVAPETDGAMKYIEKISDKVRVSLSHTMSDWATATEAIQKGATHVTHLYNGMTPFSHREPGVVGAASENEQVMVELICDGIHSHPSTVRATFKMFSDDRIVFISDSMAGCGLGDGQYELGCQPVTVEGKRATITGTDVIAGSVTNLMDCMKTAVKEMKIPLESAVKCATVNPAKAIGIDSSYGSLTIGKQADAVLLDDDLEIRYIIKDGVIVFERKIVEDTE